MCAFNILYTTRLRNVQGDGVAWWLRGQHLAGVNQIYNRNECVGHMEGGRQPRG